VWYLNGKEGRDMMSKISADIMVKYWRAKEAFKSFLEEERGDSHIIAVILVLVVVVGLAVIFKDQITALVNSIWDKITDTSKTFIE